VSITAAAVGRGSTDTLSLPWIIGASSVGTLIEWYDFYLYGVLALFFSKHFFSPELNPTVAFIASLFVFWTGFLVRPFGAILFGHLGDLIGRKFTFMLTLSLMGAATFVVGLLPGFGVIGALAPILLVSMRVLQGLALGGEYGGAATYMCRARTRRQARVLYELDPDHGYDGDRPGAFGNPNLPTVVRRPGVRRLGLACAVPALRDSRPAVGLYSDEARGVPAVCPS
jgi:hypothetical protein